MIKQRLAALLHTSCIRRFSRIALFTLFSATATAEAEKPNFLFVVADDLNDFIGVMNSQTGVHTPNIDKLANQGTLFTNAHSNAPVCSPSRASFLSGIYPHRSGHYNFNNWRSNPVLNQSKTLMEFLSEQGYHTTGAGKVMHHQWPSAWDEYDIRPDYTPLAFNGEKVTQHPGVPAPYGKLVGPLDSTFARLSNVPHVKPWNGKPGHEGWYYGGFKKPFQYTDENNRDPLPDEMYAQWAADKIRAFDNDSLDKPFFISLGFIRPHTPLVVPDRFFEQYPLDTIRLPELLEGDDQDTHFESIFGAKESKGRKHYRLLMESFPDKETALKQYYQAYLASVSFMDEQLGKVMAALTESRFANNTVVVFTSDHGYNLGEKDNLFKNNLWERSTRVPLIVFDPRMAGGQKIDAAVSLIDLYPTFKDLAGLQGDNKKSPAGGELNGLSLVPLMNGTETRPRTALTVVKTDKGKPNFSLRNRDWRYILYGNGKEELYHNRMDPQEHHNLADDADYATQKASLKANLLAQTADARQ
ncbi:sulfatase [Microbulbifer agarilyticus]|uniref:sulfatase n=1 Tax=Microbulbifer agarilyticus TaxID=260552 RepID=UPI001C980BC5|nr:sulfatase [Microbulbifer agarilyticus]MBY6210926.1 sulfatase [Microbulbifer agarilyticus]